MTIVEMEMIMGKVNYVTDKTSQQMAFNGVVLLFT